MHIRQTLAVAVVTTAIGSLIIPALAQDREGAGSAPDQGMNMGTGRTGHAMMGRGMMRGGTMSGGCGMMQSMNGGDGRPNSQWQAHPPSRATPD